MQMTNQADEDDEHLHQVALLPLHAGDGQDHEATHLRTTLKSFNLSRAAYLLIL